MTSPQAQAPAFSTAVKAVLFDLDGTLIDSAPDIAGAVNELLAAHHLPALSVADVTAMIGNGIDKTVERAFAAVGHPVAGAEFEALLTEMAPIYRRHATQLTTLMPGATDALAALQKRGLKIGLVTNKPQLATRNVLLHFGVLERFGVIIGADAVVEKKPAPEGIWLALDKLGVAREEAVMVGDSVTDVEAARAAGLPVILIRGGYTTEPAETLGADQVLGSLADLPGMLRGVQRAA